MGWYLDGRVSAVVGTHSHVQTADERILPRGTAYLTDLGLTGPIDSVIGVEPRAGDPAVPDRDAEPVRAGQGPGALPGRRDPDRSGVGARARDRARPAGPPPPDPGRPPVAHDPRRQGRGREGPGGRGRGRRRAPRARRAPRPWRSCWWARTRPRRSTSAASGAACRGRRHRGARPSLPRRARPRPISSPWSDELNADPSIHGILVQLPLPPGIDEDRVIAAVDPAKDVDGFHPENLGRLLAGTPGGGPVHARPGSSRSSTTTAST